MDKKILVIVGVVAIIAILGGLIYAMQKEGGKCDYTLLDSADNVKAGLTIEFETVENNGKTHNVRTVERVEDGKAYSKLTINMKNIELIHPLSFFLPGTSIFDYTSEDLPEGVTVVKDGDVYDITGTRNRWDTLFTYDLRITYADGVVYNVEGTIKEHYVTEKADENTLSIYTTKDQIVTEVFSNSGWDLNTRAVENYLDNVPKYNPEDYKGATVEDGKFGGVNIKIYTFTGTSGSMEYVDYKSYVYNGYLLKAEGKVIDRGFEYYNTYLVKIHQD